MGLLNYYKELLARTIISGEEKLAAGLITLWESVELANTINSIAEAIDEIEEFYGIEDESDDDTTEVNGGF